MTGPLAGRGRSAERGLEGEIWKPEKHGPAYDAYTMPRLAQYMGRWNFMAAGIRNRKVRLYNRRRLVQGDFVHEA